MEEEATGENLETMGESHCLFWQNEHPSFVKDKVIYGVTEPVLNREIGHTEEHGWHPLAIGCL
jgi:hypothetical protein